jgi:hypothetical protein
VFFSLLLLEPLSPFLLSFASSSTMTFFRSPDILASMLGVKKDFKVPTTLPLKTTWFADGVDSTPLARKQAMKLQIGGGWDSELQGDHNWITKEKITKLALATRKSTTIDDGYGSMLWNNSADSLAAWDKHEIGAMLTLTALTGPDGAEYVGLMASAFPSGTMDGVAYATSDGNPSPDNNNNLLPKNIPCPSHVIPVLASICRDSRESLSAGTDPLVWCNGLFSDTLVTLNGQKLTEPVLFLLGQAILPLEGTEELQLFGKLGGEDEPPSFTPGETPPTMVKANAATKNMGKQTNYLLGSRAFLLPIGNHGIPLGIPFDPASCINGETFAEACQAFTGLPNEAYDWMRNNNQLDPFLWAVENSPKR